MKAATARAVARYQILFDDPAEDPWTVECVFALQRGRPVIERLTVEPTHPEKELPLGGITQRLLRTIPFRDIMELGVVVEDGQPLLSAKEWRRLVSTASAHLGERPGKRGHPDSFYASIAMAYATSARVSDTPTADLAEEFNYSPSRMRSLIHTCRLKGFLTPTSRGRGGGIATQKALDALGL